MAKGKAKGKANDDTTGKVEPVTPKINPDLAPLARLVDDLHLDDRNARKHGKRDLDTVADSLRTYGQQKPIVVLASGKVIAGNGTLQAARSLGWTHIACVTFDDADEVKARAFAIMDNRSAELSEWDFQALSEALHSLPDDVVNDVGFAPHELEPLLASVWTPPPPPPDHGEGRHIVAFTNDEWGEIAKRKPHDSDKVDHKAIILQAIRRP